MYLNRVSAMSLEPLTFLMIILAVILFMSESQADNLNEPSLTNQLKGTQNDIHTLVIDETVNIFQQGDTGQVAIISKPPGVSIRQDILPEFKHKNIFAATYTSRSIRTQFPFNEVVPSYNIDLPMHTGFIIELRVGRDKGDFWTSFYYLGSWGKVPQEKNRILKDENGLVDVDYFRSRRLFDRVQYRVRLYTTTKTQSPVLRRFSLVYSHTLNEVSLARSLHKPVAPLPKHRWIRRLPVPFRSQQIEDHKIQSSICSPTSLSMVMEYRGVNRTTTQIAKTIYDQEYNIFGNWARAIQGAYMFGIPGYLTRFSDWNEVKQYITNDTPIIASIKVDAGELQGAPYNYSDGHIVVITGFNEDGNVHVNDPAGTTPQEGQVIYKREDMEKVWFGHGGVGYVLLPSSSKAMTRCPRR